MIPKEAIEAAHAAICEESLKDCLDPDWRGKCVRAIEAAAPYLRAQALVDAAAAIEALRPEMGPGINITQYREGRNDAFVRAVDVCTARAVTERGEDASKD